MFGYIITSVVRTVAVVIGLNGWLAQWDCRRARGGIWPISISMLRDAEALPLPLIHIPSRGEIIEKRLVTLIVDSASI